jgi:hypothetical protein
VWGSGLLVAGLAAGFLGGGSALAVTGADEVADGALPFVAKADFGGVRNCTGALIEAHWIVTAKNCFADGSNAVVAGVPAKTTTDGGSEDGRGRRGVGRCGSGW